MTELPTLRHLSSRILVSLPCLNIAVGTTLDLIVHHCAPHGSRGMFCIIDDHTVHRELGRQNIPQTVVENHPTAYSIHGSLGSRRFQVSCAHTDAHMLA